MLILSRRPGEVIQIGNDVTLKVMDIGGGRVRLGFEAPRHIAINRAEVQARIQAQETQVAEPVG